MKFTKVTCPVTFDVPVGYWLVTFDLCWNAEEDGDGLHDVDGFTVRQLTEDDTGYAGMSTDTNAGDRYDDTHDFRDRLFETEDGAREHAEATLRRWRNPQPWESFVRV